MRFTKHLTTSPIPFREQKQQRKTQKPGIVITMTAKANSHQEAHKRRKMAEFAIVGNYKYLINKNMTATRTTIPITDRSRHMQEQPPLVRLFKTAKCFWTRCFDNSRDGKQNIIKIPPN
jgi:hypothetical protein